MPRLIHLTFRLRREYARQMRWREKRRELIIKHIPLVERIARQLRHKFPLQIPFDDLVQSGCVGLVEAAGRYETCQGAFDRYCYHRIRGAIIDAHKRQAYREENHDSFEAIIERTGYLPAELQVDTQAEPPDVAMLRTQRMTLLYQYCERLLCDDERDVLYEALRGVRLSDSAATRGRPISWARATLASAREIVTRQFARAA